MPIQTTIECAGCRQKYRVRERPDGRLYPPTEKPACPCGSASFEVIDVEVVSER